MNAKIFTVRSFISAVISCLFVSSGFSAPLSTTNIKPTLIGGDLEPSAAITLSDAVFIGEFTYINPPELSGFSIGQEYSYPDKIKIKDLFHGNVDSNTVFRFTMVRFHNIIPVLNTPYILFTKRNDPGKFSDIIKILPSDAATVDQVKSVITKVKSYTAQLGVLRESTFIFTGYVMDLKKPSEGKSLVGTAGIDILFKGPNLWSSTHFVVLPGEPLPEPYVKYLFFLKEVPDSHNPSERNLNLLASIPVGNATYEELKQMISTFSTASP